ncbi:SPX domain-containing protein [Gaertneriomyces semiglobifer]|nr:SPX domain-containing protein [Gaertneriomyces semiglobifer]
MKFAHSISLNASPDWQDYYIAYSQLKKIVYAVEKAMIGVAALPSSPHDLDGDQVEVVVDENRPLLGSTTPEEGAQFFRRALDEQLDKIVDFYTRKEREGFEEVESLLADVMNLEAFDVHGDPEAPSPRAADDSAVDRPPHINTSVHGTWPRRFNSNPQTHVEEPPIEEPSSPIWLSKAFKQHRIKFTKRAMDLFIVLCELKDYVELNYTGFSKILKKFDKVTAIKIRRQYMATKVDQAYPFRTVTKERLNDMIDKVVGVYARIHTDGKLSLALSELKSRLRDRIIWERNTIWKDMIEQERRRQTVALKPKDDAAKTKWIVVNVGGRTMRIPRLNAAGVKLLTSVLVLVGLLMFPVLDTPEQSNCFAILVFASLLWAFEALPLFITAILVPFLVVLLRVLRAPETCTDTSMTKACYRRLDAKEASRKIFSDMFGPVIMLLLGGFSLAAALSKHHIAKGLASFILGKAGSKPQSVLLANMFVSTFASMWISNVAAPVLCFSLVTPILRNLPSKSAYARCLVMGIALAANVGGMASPISSPQNIIAIGTMDPPPSWPQWFLITIPVVVIVDLLIWLFLLFVYRPSNASGAAPPELFSHNYFKEHPLTGKQWWVIGVSVVTIVLWCLESGMEQVVGDMGVVAIVPIVAFYATGILTKDDWNSMLWSVVMLAMGGIALGRAVDSSGLLHAITTSITPHLQGLSPFECMIIFSGLVLVMTTFISHTVGALIILPIILEVGKGLDDPRPNTLVMAAALMCSGAMGLPVSSFPNMNAISLEDPTGLPWVTVTDFMKVGLPSSVIAWFVLMAVAWPIMGWLGFQ